MAGRGRGEPAQLASCYRRVLEVADELGARSVAVPAISTGIYGYPAEPAALVAASTLAEAAPGDVDEAVLVAFDGDTEQRYRRLLAER